MIYINESNLTQVNMMKNNEIEFINNARKSIQKWFESLKNYVTKFELDFRNKILSIIRRKTKSMFQWFSKRHLDRISLIIFMLK